MKGYRTIAFHVSMLAIGMLGVKIAPATIDSWLDIFFAAWGIGAILLRVLTTTPLGKAISPEVDAVLANIKQMASQAAGVMTKDDVAAFSDALQILIKHAQSNTSLASTTSELSEAVGSLMPSLRLLAVQAAALPSPSTDPVTVPLAPTVAGAVSAPASADPLPSPALAAPTQLQGTVIDPPPATAAAIPAASAGLIIPAL